MNTDRIKQRLGVETSKISVNTDTHLKINLDSEQRLLPPDEINHVVNVGDRFNVERQRSTFYRILGTITPNMSNALFNLNDSVMADQFTWAGFNYLDTVTQDYRFIDELNPKKINYSQVINYSLLEKDGWFGYKNPDIFESGLCSFFDMEPARERFSFVPDIAPYHNETAQPVKNWELTITYPKEMDKTHYMVSGGLIIIEAVSVVISNRNMTAFGMPSLHNLNTGDMVNISGTNGYDGKHIVIRTGLDNGDLQQYYFVIDKPFSGGTVSGNSRLKRIFDGQESEYYFRKFRKIKTRNTPVIESDDYETYPLAFSQSIFNDKITQFVFNEDIDVSDLTDNLGRPISELYLTMVKTDSNGLFGKIVSGIETPFISEFNTSDINTFLLDIPVINKIHNGGALPFHSYKGLELNVNKTDLDLYGDLVEYNSHEVKETILAGVSHRFNTLNRETKAGPFSYVASIDSLATPPVTYTTIDLGPRQEGYFYKAHHLIKIREFSSYIEQGDSSTGGIPDYAVKLDDGRYLWRDLLDIGFNESNDVALNYPFLNGCHYMYDNYCFSVRRQDPFDDWGLLYSKFPADPIGERMVDKFKTNTAEDVC